MIAEAGHFSLILALALSLLLTLVPSVGVFKNNALAMRAAPSLALGICFFVWLAYLALTEGFISNDFSIAYVANNSNTQLPLFFRISAVWGGHEGSLLLWIALLSALVAVLSLKSQSWSPDFRARVLSVLGAVMLGFLLFILLTSNPFERLLPFSPVEGRDLNPLLQDFALIIHPPTLYMGYVGFSVAFALAVAALWEGRLDGEWAKRALPWTLWAWAFLSLGIVLGSWWAYYELGWGGWWFWDPVENASLMPWLIGIALIHSLLVTKKSETFKGWTLLFAILAFSLSLLGTFLVRSGILSSVHSFANDPERGLFILGFLVIVIGAALALYAVRAPMLRAKGSFNLWSRESLFLSNNVILFVACATILLATLYPLLLELLNAGTISVGAPYFNTLFVPLFIFLLFLMVWAPNSRWQMGTPWLQDKKTLAVLLFSFLFASLLFYFFPNTRILTVIAIAISIALIISTLLGLAQRLKKLPRSEWYKMSRTYAGMVLAHIGLAISALGIALSSAYSVERDLRMNIGGSVQIAAYTFTLKTVEEVKGSNYQGIQGRFEVFKNGKEVALLFPERRLNNAQGILTTKTAIDPGFFRDLYVALGEAVDNSWSVRVYYKPFVRWIWLGGLLMAIGAAVGASRKPK